jgi:hypothetical protein
MKQAASILSKVQKELNAPKNRRNNFGNYNYRNCEDIVEAVKKVMPENCAVTLSDDIWLVGDRFYVKATATFYCGEEAVVVTAYARESTEKKGMDAAMCTGAASSYARKYALNGLFAIDDSDDIDSHDNRDESKKAQQVAATPIVSQLLTKDQVFKLSETVFKAKMDSKTICAKYGTTSFEQLTNAQAKEIAAECQLRYASMYATTKKA